MFTLNSKRINPDAPLTTPDGVTYANLRDPSVREQLGVQEIPDPQPPEDYSDETYYRTEQDTAPYVVFTRKSDEQIEQARRAKVQAQIDALEQGALMPRATREFMLLSMESMFTADQLAQNPGYRAVKAFDNQVAALRAQL